MRTALDFSQALTRAGFHPACDIEEAENHFFVSFGLPGVSKEGVKSELEDDELSVSGERKELKRAPDEKQHFHFAERSLSKFHRVFTVPTAVKAKGVQARFADGVLTIALPKAAAAKPRQIHISE